MNEMEKDKTIIAKGYLQRNIKTIFLEFIVTPVVEREEFVGGPKF